MGIPTGAASDPMLRVGRLQDLGDTAPDVIGVLRICAAHGLVVVCVAEGLVLSPVLSEAARQWNGPPIWWIGPRYPGRRGG